MRIGTDTISPMQSHYLERAKVDARFFHQGIRQLIDDADIRSDRESVDPTWARLYEQYGEELKDYLPPGEFEQIASFIQKMSPYQPELASIDPNDSRICFLLGAGASKPSPSDIPTVKELLPELLTRARRLDREDLIRLDRFCRERKIDNIEDLLTAAQLATFCSRNTAALNLLNFLLYKERDDEDYPRRKRGRVPEVDSVAFLQDTLQVLFGLLSNTMLPAKPNLAHQAIASYVEKHRDAAIVTTNYDCCMDLVLGHEGKDFQYSVEFSIGAGARQQTNTLPRLIKLHGSLNWFYCETCQDVHLVDIRETLEQYLQDKMPFPVIGICRKCGGQRRGLLVPPLAMKFDVAPPLNPLLERANEAFEQADVIVVVGFSFAEADLYLSRMLSRSMQRSANQKLIVIDPDADVVARVRRKFEAIILDFDPHRVIRAAVDCVEAIPKFLAGELRATVEVTSDVAQAVTD